MTKRQFVCDCESREELIETILCCMRTKLWAIFNDRPGRARDALIAQCDTNITSMTLPSVVSAARKLPALKSQVKDTNHG